MLSPHALLKNLHRFILRGTQSPDQLLVNIFFFLFSIKGVKCRKKKLFNQGENKLCKDSTV